MLMPRLPLVLAFLLVLLASQASAQPLPPSQQVVPPPVLRTTIAGTVRDSGGGALPGASVRLTAQDGTFSQETSTDAEGRFLFAGIPVGVYGLEAALSGFQVVRREKVSAAAGGNQSIDLVFQLGSLTETVTVSAQEAVPIRWNAWMESPGALFRPATLVEPGQQYSFVVDLAGVDYAASGVTSRTVSTALSEHFEEWLEDHPEYTESHLTVLIVPDARAFRTIGPASGTLVVSLTKLRAFLDDPPDPPADAIAEFRADPDRNYVFGRLRFSMGVEPAFEGAASVGLSIWHGMRPVDELVLSFCVARTSRARRCNGRAPIAQSLHGIDAARLGVDAATSEPDLALHFIDFPGQQVLGVLRRRGSPTEFTTWPLQMSAKEFRDGLTRVTRELGANTEDEPRRRIGIALYSHLFPIPSAREARAEFETAVRAMAGRRPFEHEVPPLLFIRSIMASSDAPYIPASLLYPPSLQSFIGYHLRTEMPLPLQTYESSSRCIDKWVFLVPPTETEQQVRQARLALGNAISIWKDAGHDVYEDVAPFVDWIGADTEDDAPTALAVLSHHEQNALRFAVDQAVLPEHFTRTLKGSIAILSACGSAPPGPGAVVQHLNRSGVVAIIGTTSNVAPAMGAAMLRALARSAETSMRPEARSLSQLFRQAQRDLFENAASEGHKPSDVLKYILLGHAGVQICTPALTR